MTATLVLLAALASGGSTEVVWQAPEEGLLSVIVLPDGRSDVHYNPAKVYQQVTTIARVAGYDYELAITYIEVNAKLRPEEAATAWGWRESSRIYAFDRLVWQDSRTDKVRGIAYILEIREGTPGAYLVVLKRISALRTAEVGLEDTTR